MDKCKHNIPMFQSCTDCNRDMVPADSMGTDLIREETIGQKFGRLGGTATRKKYGKKHFKELAQKRWEKTSRLNDTERSS